VYFYDVKIQTNIKQNLVKKYAEELQIFKNIFLKFFFGPGWTQPTHFGPVNSGALSTVHTEQWRQCSEEEEEEKEEEEGRWVDLRWLRGCAVGGG
jgi:hypothetical protein